MPFTASTQPQGVTFTPDQEDIAERIERAEGALYLWACGTIDAAKARRIMAANGVHPLERLNPHGGNTLDATVDGFGTVTLSF